MNKELNNCIHDQRARMDMLYNRTKSRRNKNTILVKRETPEAKIPTKSNSTDAGFDLYATEAATMYPSERRQINTGISMAIPNGHVGLIWPRSGSAVKFGIDTLAGVIDSEYRGEICVILQNHGNLPYTVTSGDRVAQIIIHKIPDLEMKLSETLNDTERGTGGFGSTGA